MKRKASRVIPGKLMTLTAEPLLPVVADNSPDALIALAINKDLDIVKLQMLIQMRKDFEADLAKKSYTKAFSEFQRNCGILKKTAAVSFQTSKGQDVNYNIAPLSDIDSVTKAPLANAGLAKDWDVVQTGDDIIVTCVITHVDGHEKRVTLKAKKDDSGSKNDIQALGSTITYLQRYSFMAALGLTAQGMDDDGRGHNKFDGVDAPQKEEFNVLGKLSDQQFDKLMVKIRAKELTLADVRGLYHITATQEKSLSIAEREANK